MTQRYEKEIEEILKKSGEPSSDRQPSVPGEPPPERSRRRRRNLLPSPGRGMLRAAISYKHLLLAGVGMLIISIFIGGLPMFLIGAGLLVASYVLYYRAPRSGGGGGSNGGERAPKMWRGRMIEPGDDPHFTQDRWGRRK